MPVLGSAVVVVVVDEVVPDVVDVVGGLVVVVVGFRFMLLDELEEPPELPELLD